MIFHSYVRLPEGNFCFFGSPWVFPPRFLKRQRFHRPTFLDESRRAELDMFVSGHQLRPLIFKARFQNVLTCTSRSFNLKVIRDPNSGFVRQNVMLRDHVYRAQSSKHKHVGLFENSVPENRDVELQYIAVDPFLFDPPRNHYIVDSFNRSIPSMVGNPSHF